MKQGRDLMRIMAMRMGSKVWKGTDALTLVAFPPGKLNWYVRIVLRRLKWRLIHRFYKHVVVSQSLGYYLELFGIKAYDVEPDPPIDVDGIEQIAHKGVNILYYFPGDRGNKYFKRWVYGFDLYVHLQKAFPAVRFYVVNGQCDMRKIYPIIDGYIRPNRHDGEPRMVLECEALGIPCCVTANYRLLCKFIRELCESNSYH